MTGRTRKAFLGDNRSYLLELNPILCVFFPVMNPRSLEDRYQRPRGKYCLCLQGEMQWFFSQKDKINVDEKQDHSKHKAIVTASKNENINLHTIIQQDSTIQMLPYWLTFHFCFVLKISSVTQCTKIGFQLRERHYVFQTYFWCCSCQCHLAISYERRKEPTGRAGGRVEFNQKTLL